jgi:cyclase
MRRKVFAETIKLGTLAVFLVGLLSPGIFAQRQAAALPESVARVETADAHENTGPLELQRVQGRVYMLSGAGANITVQVGDEAVVVVDTGRPDTSQDVLRFIRQLSNRPIEFVINTTLDADHIGGNENISKAGHYDSGQPGEKPGAAIMAHLNLLNRLTDAKAPSGVVPTDTYEEPSWSLFNDEAIILYHPPAAHTDADSYVFFRRSDVISTGDLFEPSQYPVIEKDKGGSIDGIIDGLNDIIGLMVPRENEEGGTYLIPGHGRICDRTDIVNYRDALTIIRARIQDSVSKGMTLDQVKASKPTSDYDGNYGSDSGPWTTSMFIEAVYNDLRDKSNDKSKESGKSKTKAKGPDGAGGKG